MSTRLRFIFGILFLIIGWIITYQTRLLECVSESLQGIRYIFVWKSSAFTRGDIVFIKDHKIDNLQQTKFVKRILGLPGDHITRGKDILSIGSIHLPLLKNTQEGKPLTPLSALQVPKDHVFIAGDHPRSFDSRYEEFGLVPLEKIWGRGVATW